MRECENRYRGGEGGLVEEGRDYECVLHLLRAPPLLDKQLYHYNRFSVHNAKEDTLHIKTIKCHLQLCWMLVQEYQGHMIMCAIR